MRGFSLVEMLVALFIMSTAVVFSTITINTIKVTRDMSYENVAFRITERKLEELRAGGYSNLPVSGSFSNSELADLPQGTASTSITVWNAETKKVSAGASWYGADGVTRYVSLTTLITETGGL